MDKKIGGYIKVHLNTSHYESPHKSYNFQSSRAALVFLLNSAQIKTLWIPKYICGVVPDAIKNNTRCKIKYYSINSSFEIIDKIVLSKNEFVLLVNYFGVLDKKINNTISNFKLEKVILDCSQSFFYKNSFVYASIYSPRKFFGLVDGGLLVTDQKINTAQLKRYPTSFLAIIFIIAGKLNMYKLSYYLFKKNEIGFKNNSPKKITMLSEILMRYINFDEAKSYRNLNYRRLWNGLSQYNKLNLDYSLDGPLCFPFLPKFKIHNAKQRLQELGIFIPSYWHDVLENVSSNSFEAKMVNEVLAIPCDQRYGVDEMNYIILTIKLMVDKNE